MLPYTKLSSYVMIRVEGSIILVADSAVVELHIGFHHLTTVEIVICL
jgi:hypothetical protein